MSRRGTKCVILGAPVNLSINFLPTIADVLKYWTFLVMDMRMNDARLTKPTRKIAHKVQCVWERASIPTVCEKRICAIIDKIQKEREVLTKSYKRDKNRPSYQKKVANFREKVNCLLDIASCKCQPNQRCFCRKDLRVYIFGRILILLSNVC